MDDILILYISDTLHDLLDQNFRFFFRQKASSQIFKVK